ncbi:MAG: ABC transporter substrate-binding protein [Clostridia bacterium]|nr:ABC transporter substrate-binding protein [Clostridia bacterium]
MKKLACIIAGFTLCSACGFVACTKNTDITVYAPDGAPALALAKLLKDDTKDDGVTYRIVNPQTVTTMVTYKDENKNADLCVLPLTDATQYLGDKDDYKLLGVVTHGNLYIISQDQTQVTDVSAFSGEEIGVLQLQKTPGQVFKSILQKNGVADVTLTNITGGGEVGALSNVKYYVLAEPAVTAQKGKGFHIVGNVQTLYGGENGFPQAVLVAKSSVIEENPAFIKEFVRDVQSSATWLATATGEEIVSAVSSHTENGYQTTLKAQLLQPQTLARCGVYFTQAKDAKTEIEGFLQDVSAIDEHITVIPNDGFYCLTDFNA